VIEISDLNHTNLNRPTLGTNDHRF